MSNVEEFPLARVTDRKLNELMSAGDSVDVDAVREEMRQRINKYRRERAHDIGDIPPRGAQ
jgi:hypothetical protein